MQKTHSHHRYHLHGIRVVFLGLSLIALCIVRVDGLAPTQNSSAQVLAYATNINRSALLAETNAARAQNGLGALALNGQLNNAAQGKSQHMIDYNYWAHVAPDGTQPWYFFEQAGYSYTRAGENLAYGFDSSSSTITAWMNSASHRANILGDYADVGFGIADGANFQGGPNTVVVAHYGKQTSAPAPPPPPPAPTAPTAPTAPQAPTAPADAAPSTPVAEPTEATPVSETPAQGSKEPVSPENSVPTATADKEKSFQTSEKDNVNLFQAIATGSAPMYGFVSLGLLMSSMGGFMLTHRALFQHAVVTSETYVMKHPMVDFAAFGAIAILVLTTTISRI